jgi:thymidylate synthase
MKEYLDLVKDVVSEGYLRPNRTNVNAFSSFGHHLEIRDIYKGFPLLTTKFMSFNSIKAELLWFLSGDSNVQFLHDRNCTIWDEWASEDGDLGKIYGYQWRKAEKFVNGKIEHVDQISKLINDIKSDHLSRRLIVNSWNICNLDEMALPPCHILFQVYCENGGLSMQVYQRSADLFLGVPFNIASYALLLCMLAQVTGYYADRLLFTFGDIHIYSNHMKQIETQLQRNPLYKPILKLNHEIKDIFKFQMDDIKLENYTHHPKLTGEVAV